MQILNKLVSSRLGRGPEQKEKCDIPPGPGWNGQVVSRLGRVRGQGLSSCTTKAFLGSLGTDSVCVNGRQWQLGTQFCEALMAES